MSKKFHIILIFVVLSSLVLSGTAGAANAKQYTIDVRNRTGLPVELNYKTTDGILHMVTVPSGVSSLTLFQGVYQYWADPKCGHIAGTFNLTQQRQILWIQCDADIPSLELVKRHKVNHLRASPYVFLPDCTGYAYQYNFYDWNAEWTGWAPYNTVYMCSNVPATEGDSELLEIWLDGNLWWYEYHQTGVVAACGGWGNPGEGWYFTYSPGTTDQCP